MRRLLATLGLWLVLLVGGAQAHTSGSTGFATVTVRAATVRYALTLPAEVVQSAWPTQDGDFGFLADLVARHVAIAANGHACAATPGTVSVPSPTRSTLVVTIDYACVGAPRTLSLSDTMFDLLGPDHHTLASIDGPDGRVQIVFDPDHREANVALAAETAAATPQGEPAEGSAIAFFRMGVEHILTGYDHILFLFALMLRGGRLRSILGIITAFTIAHSITLALASLGVVVVPPALVEPIIALSIAYVALENIYRKRAASGRWLVSFVFGLVHGLGFAGPLLELGLPRDALLWSLPFFNIGVEVGQAIIVAALFPLLTWFGRFAWERGAVTALSAVVFIGAILLAIERVVYAQV